MLKNSGVYSLRETPMPGGRVETYRIGYTHVLTGGAESHNFIHIVNSVEQKAQTPPSSFVRPPVLPENSAPSE